MRIRTVKLARAAVAVVLVATAAACSQQPGGVTEAESAQTAQAQEPQGFRYIHEVFDQVEATEGVVYRTTTTAEGDEIELAMDIYEPAGDTAEQRPAVFWMFGGGWQAGDRAQMEAYARDSARRGYVGITVDYRIRPGGNIVDAAWDAYDDSVAAAQWIADNAGDYGIDPDAIVAGGYSAGAINSLHLLYAPGTRGPDEPPIAGAVAIAGMTFTAPPENRPPAIMHHAVDDNVVAYDSGESACNATRDAGNECYLTTYDSGGHYITFSDDHQPQIHLSTAYQVFARVLYPQGYEIELLPLR